MSATGKTPNYDYPLYNVGDFTNWADYNALAAGTDRDIFAAAAQANAAKAQAEEVSAEVATVQNTLTGALEDIGEVKQSNENLNTRVENAETHLNDVDEKIEALQNSGTTAAGQIATLQNEVSGNTSSIAQNTNAITTLTQRINSTSDLVGQHSTDISQMRADISEVQSQVQLNTSEVNELSGDVASIQADLQNVKKNGFPVLSTRRSISDAVVVGVAQGRLSIRARLGFTAANIKLIFGNSIGRNMDIAVIYPEYTRSEVIVSGIGVVMNENTLILPVIISSLSEMEETALFRLMRYSAGDEAAGSAGWKEINISGSVSISVEQSSALAADAKNLP